MISFSLLVAIGLATWNACTFKITREQCLPIAEADPKAKAIGSAIGLITIRVRKISRVPTYLARAVFLLVALGCARALVELGGMP